MALVVATALILLLAAPAAFAAHPSTQPGVHVDPGSPAGKQYGLPIGSARGETSGQSGSHGSQNPPAFGVGVTRSTTPATSATAREPTTATQPAATPAAPKRTRKRNSAPVPAAVASSLVNSTTPSHDPPLSAGEASSTGGSGWIVLVLGGALVLVVGGAAGLALRRRAA